MNKSLFPYSLILHPLLPSRATLRPGSPRTQPAGTHLVDYLSPILCPQPQSDPSQLSSPAPTLAPSNKISPDGTSPGHLQTLCHPTIFNPSLGTGDKAPKPQIQSGARKAGGVVDQDASAMAGSGAGGEDLIAPFSHAIYLFRPDPQRSICIGKRNSEQFS